MGYLVATWGASYHYGSPPAWHCFSGRLQASVPPWAGSLRYGTASAAEVHFMLYLLFGFFTCTSIELVIMLVPSSFLCFYVIFLHRNNYSNVMWEPRVKVMLIFRYTVLLSEICKLIIKKNTQRRHLSDKISSKKCMQSLKLRKNHFRFELCK